MRPEGSAFPPETQYAHSGDFSIAFQVLGDGPIELVFVPGFVSNLELTWDWPPLGAFYRAFTSFARVTLFDKRGTGLSDRVRLMPTTDERMDDLRAVMDASACERAAVVGISEGAPLAISFAAAYPERVSALILYGPLPKATRTDDYPWAQPRGMVGGGRTALRAGLGQPRVPGGRRRLAGAQRTRQRGIRPLVGHLPPTRCEPWGGRRSHSHERADRRSRAPTADHRSNVGHGAGPRPGDLRRSRALRR